MCLAIPMKITEVKDGSMATVTVMGTVRDVALDLTPQAQVGDYVLVHAGFAIEIVDQQYAEETLSLIEEMSDMLDDPLLNPAAEGAML